MNRRLLALLLVAAAGCALFAWRAPGRPPLAVSILDFADFDTLVLERDRPDPDPFARPYPRRYRLAILSYLTPQELHRKGKLLGDYLRAHLGVEITPIYSANYDSLADLMRAGKAEIVWASPVHYAAMRREIDYTLAAKISSHGRGDYGGVIIVARDAPYRTIEELAGRRFAFVDPSSSSGFQLPSRWFAARGIDPFRYFAEVRFSGKHDLAVDDVVKGRVDAAAVYDSVYDFRTDLIRTEEIRTLVSVGTVPQAPILVSNTLPAEERERIRDLLLRAHEKAGGDALLAGLRETEGFTGFLPATEAEYDE